MLIKINFLQTNQNLYNYRTMNKKTAAFFQASLAIATITVPAATKAFCPVCTVAVGAGLGLSRYLKIDDAISGIWIGAILMSTSLWFASYLKKKNKNTLWAILFAVFLYVTTFVPLKYYGVIGHSDNALLGLDKLVLGSIIGTIAFPPTIILNNKIKSSNNGKSYFPLQKVVVPIVVLLLLSLIMYLIVR